jgi:hypothetical protein
MTLQEPRLEPTCTYKRCGTAFMFAATLLSLSACGGGGGGGDVAAPASQTPASIIISGVVAKGAAFAGSTVVAVNSNGTLGSPILVGPDGTYSMTLPNDVKLPIVLTASRQTGTGEIESFSTIVSDKANVVANITPITNLIAALLSSNGRPEQLATQVTSGAAITQEMLNAKTQTVQSIIKTAVDALGVASIDPIRGSFTANSTGYSKLLDTIAINIVPTSNSTNIEVALKSKASADTAQPATSRFISSQTTVSPLPAVVASDFPIDGISVKINQLMADAQSCYALPLSSRVSGVSATASTAVGNASLISAPICKGIFFENNPAKYLNSSAIVGRDENGLGAFSALYISSSTGTKFDNQQYEYTLNNGDISISFQTTQPGSVPVLSTNTLRLDPSDQKLKFIGDQYQFNGRVLPLMQKREFPVLNLAQWNYLSTGYSVNVDNTGQFDRVEVTAPTGGVYTLQPSSASTSLVFAGKGPSNYLRLRAEFMDANKSFAVPTKLTSEALNFAFETPDLSEQAITTIAAQSAWTLRYFISGNTGTTPNAIQVYRTRARAMTIAEFRNKPTVSVVPATQAAWSSSASTVTGFLPLAVSSPFNLSWNLPVGALSPVNASLGGRFLTGVSATSSARFTDFVNFVPNSTSASIGCFKRSLGDIHCDGAANGGFKLGSEANAVNLIGVDYLGRNIETQYGLTALSITP